MDKVKTKSKKKDAFEAIGGQKRLAVDITNKQLKALNKYLYRGLRTKVYSVLTDVLIEKLSEEEKQKGNVSRIVAAILSGEIDIVIK